MSQTALIIDLPARFEQAESGPLRLESGETQPIRLDLLRDQPLRLVRARGTRITARQGQLWITVVGHAGDVFLAAGQSWTIPLDGLALVEAIGGDATMQIDRPASRVASWRGAFRHWVARMRASPAPG